MNETAKGINEFLKDILNNDSHSDLKLIEKIQLFWVGWRDGKHALPRENGYGEWESSTISKELSSCIEAHNKVYGTLRINVEDSYKAAESLVSLLIHNKKRIEELKKKVPEPLSEEKLHIRRYGEEMLEEILVMNRRSREQERKIESVLDQIEELKKKSEDDLERLVELKCFITQKNYEAELVCDRLRAHTKQRIDYYWNIAYRRSFALERIIPPTCMDIVIPNAVDRYKAAYRDNDKRIEDVLYMYNFNKEVA